MRRNTEPGKHPATPARQKKMPPEVGHLAESPPGTGQMGGFRSNGTEKDTGERAHEWKIFRL
jgi:hypothetical protein